MLFSNNKNLFVLESYYLKSVLEAGCDEAGRGCLAGPVTAAAVILPPDYNNTLLNDSKKLSEKNRDILRIEIEKEAIDYAVAFIDNHEIDQINILRASIKAMHGALLQLKQEPEHIIVDGNRFYPFRKVPHKCIVKGDGKYYSIAAASILAKTYRDEFMKELDLKFPEYLFKKHKGYPTKLHREAISQYGITDYHRTTFQLLNKQLALNFEDK
jgi:ribonuclease HII